MAEIMRRFPCRLHLAGLLLAAASLSAGGCATRSAADASTANMARIIKEQRRQESALAAAEPRLPAEREEATAERFEALGDYYLQQENVTLAFINYNKALRLEPSRPALRRKIGLLYIRRSLPEEAERVFLELLNEDPGDPQTHMGLGRATFMEERFEESERYFHSALERDDQLWEAHNYLGILYNRQGRIEEALREFAGAMTLQPDSGMLYNNLGVSFLLARQYDRAARAFEQALSLGAAGQKTYNNLALSLGKMGKYEAALEVFRASGSAAQAFNNVGYLLLLEDRYEEAIEALEKAIEKSPSYYVRANANRKKAQTHEAGRVD